MNATAVAPEEPETREVALAGIIRRLGAEEPDLSDWDLAGKTLAEIEPEPSKELLLTQPAVASYAREVRRAPVRRLEHRLRRGWGPSSSTEERRLAATEWRARLVLYADERIAIPGKGKVRAGQATREDWESRVAMIQEDIDRELGTLEFTKQLLDLLGKANVETIDAYLAGKGKAS